MPFLFLVSHVFSWGPRQWGTSVKAGFSFVTYPHLRNFVKYMVSSVTYIHQGEILLLNHFLFSDLHQFKGFCQVYGFVSNVHPSRRNLVTYPIFCFLFESWLDLLARRHWLNSSFINFKSGYIHLVHPLVVLLQVFNVPWLKESLSVYGFQVVTALSRVVDDSARSFPCGAKLSLGGISGRSGNLVQDEIPYVKSSKLYSLIVVFSHLRLILHHSNGSFFSYFIQTIQVDLQVIVIAFFIEYLSLDAGYSYLNWEHGFSAIGELEGGFSRRGSCRGSVNPQDVGQFFRSSTLHVVQLGFDDLEQCSICNLHLSIRLGMPWG